MKFAPYVLCSKETNKRADLALQAWKEKQKKQEVGSADTSNFNTYLHEE